MTVTTAPVNKNLSQSQTTIFIYCTSAEGDVWHALMLM